MGGQNEAAHREAGNHHLPRPSSGPQADRGHAGKGAAAAERWPAEAADHAPAGGSGRIPPAGSRLKRPVLRILGWIRAMIAAIHLTDGGTGRDSGATPRARLPEKAGFTRAIAAVPRMADGIAACWRERPGDSCPGMPRRPDGAWSRKEKATTAS